MSLPTAVWFVLVFIIVVGSMIYAVSIQEEVPERSIAFDFVYLCMERLNQYEGHDFGKGENRTIICLDLWNFIADKEVGE